LGAQLDGKLTRRAWLELITFPGIVSMLVMVVALFPGLLEVGVPALFGTELTTDGMFVFTLCVYVWMPLTMLGAWIARKVEPTAVGRVLAPALIYLVGYGSLLCAITFDSYIKELRHAEARWDKTEKVGRVAV
jgi:hypothetical protein